MFSKPIAPAPQPWQPSLFGTGTPRIDPRFEGVRHIDLGQGAWVEHRPGWLQGHAQVFEALRTHTQWHQGRREMYERMVDVPRLTASLPKDGPGHPVIDAIAHALEARYAAHVRSVSLALYRDGRDSVALHGDRGAAADPTALTISVSVGAPRHFLLKPRAKGPSRSFELGWGDLLVMGGTIQAHFLHGIPKIAAAQPRIAILFWCGLGPRPTASRPGEPPARS